MKKAEGTENTGCDRFVTVFLMLSIRAGLMNLKGESTNDEFEVV